MKKRKREEEKETELQRQKAANDEYLKEVDQRIPLTPSSSAEKVIITKYKVTKVRGRKLKLV